MNLQCVTVQGFRRFVKPSSIRLNERLIALVGPNEAGKSSILSALVQAGSDNPFEQRDCPRRRAETVQIAMIYRVTDEDRQAMTGIAGANELQRCTITKKMDGKPIVALEPPPPHDLTLRKKLAEVLGAAPTNALLSGFGNTPDERAQRMQRLQAATGALKSANDYLGQSALAQLASLLGADLRPLANNPKATEADRDHAKQVADALEMLIKHEEPSGPEKIRQILLRRRPPVLFFDDASRELAHSYDLGTHAANPPPALANLCRLCELNLPALLAAASTKNIPLRDEILEAANNLLKQKFAASWVRKEVVPQLGQDGKLLYLHIRTGDGATLSPITDRSDGLRWFVALIAFLSGRTSEEKPILLVDEAETHLSYDAQASLVDVLETQEVAQKIIYTTHSAGCLPSDLGSGIRSVIPVKVEQSEVSNSFWNRAAGFSPLMMSMGLSPFAFTVARNVLIAEGPSECFLLPSLIREATGLDLLRYQVAPGASIVGRAGVDELISQSERGAFVLDGDDAGESLRDKLKGAGIADARIKTYRDLSGRKLTFEDLVSPDVYVEAFNTELHLWKQTPENLTTGDFGDLDRANSVNRWCAAKGLEPISKVSLCQALAQMAAEGKKLVRPECRELLVKLHEWAMAHFPHG